MLRNYLQVAVRNFFRQRQYSIINVGGLTAGLVCVVLIYLWVNDELSKDKFHKDVDRIFLVISNFDLGTDEIISWTHAPGPLADDVQEHVSGVELVSRRMRALGHLFQVENKSLLENGFYADPGFFSMFSFKIISGSQNPIGVDKSSIAISRKFATRLFGQEDPIGKIIKYQKQYDLEVKAVFEDVGTSSSFTFDFIVPFEIFKERRGDAINWGNYEHPIYLKLTEGTSSDKVTRIINERTKLNDAGPVNFYLQPIADNYLYSNFENGKPVGGRIKFVKLFSLVAAFILIIACINFMNMATARAATRLKEVGIRKVVGAQRKSLVLQFLVESTIISLVSMILAVSIVYLTLPLFNTIISKKIEVNFMGPDFLALAGIVVVITGLLAGSYPAFFLTSFNPATVLKGTFTSSLSGTSLRKALVVFQFTLTVVLGASALVVYRQIEFIQGKNIGFNRTGVLKFPNRIKEFDAFRTEVSQMPGVLAVSRADQSLVSVNNLNGAVNWPGKSEESTILFRSVSSDYDYLEIMELNLLEGRFFSREFADSNNFVVSKKAVEIMGLKDPIGQEINHYEVSGTIIGVVDDFHSQSMQEAIDPIVFYHNPEQTSWIFVRFEGGKINILIDELTALYKKYNSDYPFEFTFLDDDFDKLYNNEKVISSLSLVFTVLTVIISGLGLFALAAYTAERRKKEISIRKILGAPVAALVTMMSSEFLKLSMVSCIIGCPVAYYLMTKFLEGYAYRPDLGWDIFLITAVCTMSLALLTVILQVAKAAIANPVDSLRSE